MPLRVVSFCSYLVAAEYPKDRNVFQASAFIKALKGKTVNGYHWLDVPGEKKRLRLTNENRPEAYRVFGRHAYCWLEEDDAVSPPLILVPVPNSAFIEGSKGRPRTALLADAVAKEFGDEVRVLSALRWRFNLGEAHKGAGSRSALVLYNNLMLNKAVPPGSNVVLIDDITTTGEHLRAAGAFLTRAAKVKVPLALCAGRTRYLENLPEDGFGPPVEETLDDFMK